MKRGAAVLCILIGQAFGQDAGPGPSHRYAVPTRPGDSGHIWVPVRINEQGPFNFLLDTGSTRSAILPTVAQRLGIRTDLAPAVSLRGVTGTSVVPTIAADRLDLGDLHVRKPVLPVIPDLGAFGGAEGLLGVEGLKDKRIRVDFDKDSVEVSRSNHRPLERDFISLPLLPRNDHQLVTEVSVNGIDALAIIDTGAEGAIGNTALHKALERHDAVEGSSQQQVVGITGQAQEGEGHRVRHIMIGGVEVKAAPFTFGDMRIFEHWKLVDRPVFILGMDVIGSFRSIVIDYPRRELMVRLPQAPNRARSGS